RLPRPQDALLSVQGAREEEYQAAHPIYGLGHHSAGEANSAFAVACPLGCGTQKNRRPLQGCLFEAKKKAREAVSGTFDFVSPLRFEEKQTNPQGIGLP